MKRLFLLLIILSIFGCEKQDNPVPRDNEPAGEEIKTVQLGENLVMQVGDKVRIKDTLYYQSAKTDSIVPVYLNYVLSLDSMDDNRRLPYPPSPTIYIPPTNLRGHFSLDMGIKKDIFDLGFNELYSPAFGMDSVCAPCGQKHLLSLHDYTIHHHTHFVKIYNNLGFCITLDSVYPMRPDTVFPLDSTSDISQFYSQYVYYLRILN